MQNIKIREGKKSLCSTDWTAEMPTTQKPTPILQKQPQVYIFLVWMEFFCTPKGRNVLHIFLKMKHKVWSQKIHQLFMALQ